MSINNQSRSGHVLLALLLSLILPGVGQLYLHRIIKGSVLIISFMLAILIIWFAVSKEEFKLFDLDGKKVMFNPAMKSLELGGRIIKVTDIMKVTGTLQLVITWLFSLIDVWRDHDKL